MSDGRERLEAERGEVDVGVVRRTVPFLPCYGRVEHRVTYRHIQRGVGVKSPDRPLRSFSVPSLPPCEPRAPPPALFVVETESTIEANGIQLPPLGP